MATYITTEPVSPSDSRESVKFRASCDRCLNIKVRCSQDKPTCKRCAKKNTSCVYSPPRCIGRPRKVDQNPTPTVDFIRDENISVLHPTGTMASTPGSSLNIDEIRQENSSRQTTVITGTSPATSAISTPQIGTRSLDSGFADTPMIDSNDRSIGNDVQTLSGSRPNQMSLNGDGSSQLSTMGSWSSVRGLSAKIHTEVGSETRRISTRPYQETSLRIEQESFVDSLDPGTDCYIAILTRTTDLEQSLILQPPVPLIDLVFEAERDARALKHRLFTCTGHTLGAPNCLASDRPVLLSLALLAECVARMLEKIFRLAAVSRNTIDWAIQDSLWSGAHPPASSARRLERSFRGLLDQPCVFPLPEANLDVKIGDYVIEGPAKARCVKRILQMRIRKLLGVLEGMKKVPRRERAESFGGTLDWGGSRDVLGKAGGFLVEDLIRRLEALQGGMALVG